VVGTSRRSPIICAVAFTREAASARRALSLLLLVLSGHQISGPVGSRSEEHHGRAEQQAEVAVDALLGRANRLGVCKTDCLLRARGVGPGVHGMLEGYAVHGL
jgi:hypothetical protein